MGLDSVMLIMEWETAFHIQIPDAEAEKINTVQDATNILLRLVTLQPAVACKTQKLFYQFRHYFEEHLGIDKHRFELSTKLSEIFPFQNRKQHWLAMEQALGWALPALNREDFNPSPNIEPFQTTNVLGRILLRRPLELPFTKHTLADLIGFVFALNYEKLVTLPVVASRFEVEKVLIGITSDKMGVAIQDIKPESSFTQDLGID